LNHRKITGDNSVIITSRGREYVNTRDGDDVLYAAVIIIVLSYSLSGPLIKVIVALLN